MKNNFAKNLKFLRLQSGMTQQELGKKLNKDYSTIGKWELGQRSPTIEDLIKISEIFNVTLKELVTVNIIKNIPYEPTTDEEFKNILIKKGLMNEDGSIDLENFEILIDFALANKRFIFNFDKNKNDKD